VTGWFGNGDIFTSVGTISFSRSVLQELDEEGEGVRVRLLWPKSFRQSRVSIFYVTVFGKEKEYNSDKWLIFLVIISGVFFASSMQEKSN
jgi:hypothetical protein